MISYINYYVLLKNFYELSLNYLNLNFSLTYSQEENSNKLNHNMAVDMSKYNHPILEVHIHRHFYTNIKKKMENLRQKNNFIFL